MAKKLKKVISNGDSRPAVIRIPAKLLSPIGKLLSGQLQSLERRRRGLDSDDPFITGREDSLASPDTNAAEQFGHARIEAVKKEIDRRLIQMRKALARIKVGSYGICEECGQMIDTDRLMVFAEATLCVNCEKRKERSK
ncbi:MAG: hypothetical protein G01um10145_568 [Microgenomates group bacterium Gr01-1014_5]|nr:MAG: hypothetical protein G01um10145_568 [Microgenomates group bacterium Gr01-1014_5]